MEIISFHLKFDENSTLKKVGTWTKKGLEKEVFWKYKKVTAVKAVHDATNYVIGIHSAIYKNPRLQIVEQF